MIQLKRLNCLLFIHLPIFYRDPKFGRFWSEDGPLGPDAGDGLSAILTLSLFEIDLPDDIP